MELQNLLQSGELSINLLENLGKWELGNQLMDQLEAYDAYITFIEKLGWVEHTCDWDLSTLIYLKNGDKVFTEPGYPNLIYNPETGIITFAAGITVSQIKLIWDTVSASEIAAIELGRLYYSLEIIKAV